MISDARHVHPQSSNSLKQRSEALAPELIVLDFFCGAGGFTCGAIMAGAKVVCGFDCDGRARKTYQANNSNGKEAVPFREVRIENLEPATLRQILSPYKKDQVLFVGCPPCQPFTNLRTSKKSPTTSRAVISTFISHVLAVRPDYVLVENVPGIRDKKHDDIWTVSVSRLRNAGYQVRSENVNAARFGVPQKRIRTVLLAARNYDPPWPKATHEPSGYRRVLDAFSEPGLLCGERLCRLEAGQVCEHDVDHVASKLSDLNLRRIRAITSPGGSRVVWPAELELNCYRTHKGHTDVYGRMDWARPSPTLTTRFVSLSNGRFGHPEEDRAITPREGALIQSFPPGYRFYDKSRDTNVMHIGNAVPPLLARAFVSAVIDRIATS